MKRHSVSFLVTMSMGDMANIKLDCDFIIITSWQITEPILHRTNTVNLHQNNPTNLLSYSWSHTARKINVCVDLHIRCAMHIYPHLPQPYRWPCWVWCRRKPHGGSGKPHWPRRKDPVCRNVSYRESSHGPNGTALCASPANTPERGKKEHERGAFTENKAQPSLN